MLVSVALPLPLFKPLTYAVPDEFGERVSVGSRVIVPVRGRHELGFVVGRDVAANGVKAKPISDAPDEAPVLDASLLKLCQWIADYYAAPIGVVLRTALPAALTGRDVPTPTQKHRRVARLVTDLPTLIERDTTFARSKKQRELFELLESLGGSAPVELLLERMSFSPSVLTGLVDRGIAAIDAEVVERDPFASRNTPHDPRHTPTADQQRAIDALAAARAGETFLLRGVTGS